MHTNGAAAFRRPCQSVLVIAQLMVATENCESDRRFLRCGHPSRSVPFSLLAPTGASSRGSFLKKAGIGRIGRAAEVPRAAELEEPSGMLK
jgi:hypothetical protein